MFAGTAVKGCFLFCFFDILRAHIFLSMRDILPRTSERPVVLHLGTFKQTATVSEAVFMITGMTIGAGILGLPYAIAQVGLVPGLVLLVAIGIVMLALNMMMSEIATIAGENLQLPGLAGKFLGAGAKVGILLILVLRSYGTLLAYLVGEGLVLSTLLGGSTLGWSVVFWSVGSILVWGGLERVKRAEKILSVTVMCIIVVIALFLLPHFNTHVWSVAHVSRWWLSIGVIMFALHALPAIGEAHALLPNESKKFKKAVVIGTLVPLCIYALFVTAVVGSGSTITEVATIGLGAAFGPFMLLAANVFAILAMSTGFMGLGTALKESLVWDFKLHRTTAVFLTISVPFALLLLGLRSFVYILEVVGGVFISIEALVMVLVYIKARQKLVSTGTPSRGHWFAVVPVVAFFVTMLTLSIYKLFL